MRLFIDARFYGLEHTGLGRYTKNVLDSLPKYLAHKDLEVSVLVHPSYKHLNFGKGWEVICSSARPYSLAEQLLVPLLVRRSRADLYLGLHFNVPLLVGVPFVTVIHDLIKSHFRGRDTTTRSPWLYQVKRWAYELTMHRTIRLAKTLIVPTNTVKNDLLAYHALEPSRIEVVPESVDTSILQPSKFPVAFTNYLLYVGNAYPHKNLSILLSALKSLPYNLVLVSKTTPHLTELLSRLTPSIRSRLYILEQVEDAELSSLYRHAIAYVAPSLMEGYGLPGLEALMLGVPLVASNIPVYREVYASRAHYFDPTSVRSLVATIKHLPPTRPKPYRVKRTWDEVAGEISEVIR